MFYPNFNHIGVIAPAGKLAPEKFEAGLRFLRDCGKRVTVGEHVNGPSETDYLAASASDRAEDLMKLWLDPEIDLLLPIRGGFGCAHLLPLLDWEKLAARPGMPLAGYSDITALHWAMERFQIGRPIAGPMLGKLPEAAQCSDTVAYRHWSGFPLKAWKAGNVSGLPLVGNLAVAVSLCGTPYMPDLAGKILILEDLNEPPYKLDRYLTTLEQNGVFEQCAAIVFGDFLDCGDVTPLFERTARQAPCPVYSCFPFGHGLPIATIDFHRPLTIENNTIYQ